MQGIPLFSDNMAAQSTYLIKSEMVEHKELYHIATCF